jgi:hypothetical protein
MGWTNATITSESHILHRLPPQRTRNVCIRSTAYCQCGGCATRYLKDTNNLQTSASKKHPRIFGFSSWIRHQQPSVPSKQACSCIIPVQDVQLVSAARSHTCHRAHIEQALALEQHIIVIGVEIALLLPTNFHILESVVAIGSGLYSSLSDSPAASAMFALLRSALCNGLWGNNSCDASDLPEIDRMAGGSRSRAPGLSSVDIIDRSLTSRSSGRYSAAAVPGNMRYFFHSTCGC